jgi:predicted Fe-Mo cluster-binding NifX family protein
MVGELIGMEKLRMAIATTAHGRLQDIVSEVFGRSTTFTIIDVEGDRIRDTEVLENPALSYEHGAGPIVVKMLVDRGVNVVIGAELGPGASALLKQHNVAHIIVKPGIRVREAIRKALSEIEK